MNKYDLLKLNIRIDLWQPTFLAVFSASRPWLFSPTLPNVMIWVQGSFASENLCILVLNSRSLAKPLGTGVHTASTIHFCMVTTRVPFLVWTYPWSAIETRPALSGTAESKEVSKNAICDVTQHGLAGVVRADMCSFRRRPLSTAPAKSALIVNRKLQALNLVGPLDFVPV
jgi:hypothetical protein